MQGLIAQKVGMSRVFLASGEAVPVTYVKVEPNTVVRTKNADKDGYNAVVLGVRPLKVQTRKGKTHMRYRTQKEWRIDSIEGVQAGAKATAEFVPKDAIVTVTGTSKGRGFQGVIKRHGFSRGPESHGSHHHRRPGSVGMKEWPGRIMRGKKMPGRMGNDCVTRRKCIVMVSDPEEGILAIKGPIPGPAGAIVFITVEQLPEGFSMPQFLNEKAVVQKAEKQEEQKKTEVAAVEEKAEVEAKAEKEESKKGTEVVQPKEAVKQEEDTGNDPDSPLSTPNSQSEPQSQSHPS